MILSYILEKFIFFSQGAAVFNFFRDLLFQAIQILCFIALGGKYQYTCQYFKIPLYFYKISIQIVKGTSFLEGCEFQAGINTFLHLQNTLYKLFLYEISYSYQVLITLIDMSVRQSRAAKKKLSWQSQNTSYQQSMSAIKLAQEAFNKEAPIPLETSINEIDSRIMRKSVRITEMARNVSHLDDSSDHHPTNIVDFIMTDIQLEDEKFGLIESPSEHSQEEETVVKMTTEEIEDIVTSVKKDPVIGKITFILKLINNKRANVEMRVLRKRGVGNVVPQIHQSRTYGNFTLYQIETNSFMKKIAIELLLDGKSAAESREISFSPRQILLDLDISYDVDKKQKLNINFLEGLLASCVLEGDLFAEEILQLNGKRELKTKILGQRYTVDDEVKRLIKENKNLASILKLLKFVLQQEKWNLGVPSDNIANPAYISLAQIFITEMLQFKPSINSDQREQIRIAQSLKLVELYIHFICLAELKTKGISISSFQKEAENKLSEFIHFVFQISQMRIYHRFIQFCIMKKSPILPQSYDTIKNYISDYNLNSSECILTNFENIFYNLFTKRASGNLVRLFIDVFLEKKFENKNIYQKEMSDILKLSSALFQQMDINSLNFAQFSNFFKAYWNFRQNPHLITIVRQASLKQKIQNYMVNFQARYQKTPEGQRPAAINVVQLYYISMKDDELVKDEEAFRRLIQYLIQKTQPKSFDPVIKIYFQIFKRAKRGFSLQFIANLSTILSRKLQNSTPEKALMLLSKYFNEDYLESEELTEICNQSLLKAILTKLINDKKTFLEEVKTRHHKWHNNFKYSSHFNEQILERMTRMVQKHLTEKIVRDAYLEQIKRQINREVQDEQKRISLIAIIDYDMLQLNVESVWGYFIEKRGYLKILIKILKRQQQSSEVLRQSLMEIHHQLETKDVDFYKIQRLKSMKPNQWHYFVQLTDQNGIPALVDRIYEQGNRYLNVLKRLQNFIRDIGAKFTSPNYEELCMKLQGLNEKYVKESIRESNIEQQISVFKGFKYEILTCYKLRPFFGTQEFNNKPIELIVKACGDLLQNLLRKIEELYISYEKGSINSVNFYYFQPRKDDIKQFRNIILMNKQQAPQHLEDIITIYNIIADAEENHRLLNSFIVLQRQKYNVESAEIIHFARIYSDLKNKSSIPVIDIQQQLNAVHNKLRQFKLNLRDHRQFFELIALMIQNSEKILFFMNIENDLKDIKDEINESGGDVEYEQIEDCEVTIEFLKDIYQVPASFSQFISAYFAFIEKKRKVNKEFALNQMVKTAFFIIPQLKEIKANMDDSNSSTVKFIDEVIKRVRFEFKNDDKNKDKVITATTIYPQGEAKLIDERQIYINKEKAIMISSTAKQGQNSQRKRQINNFLEIVKIFQQIKSQQIKLTEWGCSQFKKQSIIVEINNCQTKNANQIITKRQVQFNQWRKQIKKLYQINYKAAHLQGNKLKQFYDFICANLDSIPNHFLIIIDNLETHKSIFTQLNENPNSLIRNRELALLYNYFQLLKANVNIRQLDAPDRDENFLHFIKLAKGQVDFIKGIQQIGSERIQKLKFQQLLICTPQTSKSEIKSFIERALRDLNSEYIVIGFQNLDRRKQQFIVDQIKSFKAQYGNDSLKLKLCLIGDSELELLYKFAVQELSKSPQKTENIKAISNAYEEKLKQECSKIKIVYSSAAGLGKTSFIKNDSFNVYKCTEQYYLPLSGIMAVPVQSIDDNNNSIITNVTQKFLWDRFEQAMHFFTIAQKAKKNACLVIQIYNVEPSVVDITNKFLQSVLFFKCYKYRNNNGKLPKNIPIYIELQNVSLPAYNKLSKKFENLPPQMRMLPFLREINTVCGQKIVQYIEDFLPNHIKISNEDKQLNYILYHLKLLKTGQINTKSIPAYDTFNVQPISQEEGLKLIKQFFFDKFSNADRPSGYLWTYFRSLLLQASKSFSNSFFLTLPQVASIDNDVKQFNKELHQKMKIKETFRYQFYKVIHKNCLDFIQRSVRPGQQNGDKMFNETLKNLPFLIVPNTDGASFSFIYNNSANVPQVIKAMIVLQTPTLLPRISNLSIEKLFEEENLAALQRLPNTQRWIQKSSQILANISGNNRYKVDCERGYIVNIDNFFKMCLIVQRIRLNIPIVIMGEAGIGKTAILRHVARHLFNHQFAVYNINAGLPLESKKSVEKQKANDSLATIVENIQHLYRKIETENASLSEGQKKNAKKLWVFFDEFNTLRQLGFFKEIIVDGRYLGKQQPYIKNVVMMAACNPHKRLILNEEQKQDQFVKEQTQRLAFDVLPAPHSLIECMWNYGSLTSYQYEKYISKMLVDVRFQSDRITRIILKIHEIIGKNAYESAVSLRDIDRFRQLYKWFNENLPRHLKIRVPEILGAYNNIQERAFILSCYFTYILRFSHVIRQFIEEQIERICNFRKGFILEGKRTQQNDLCARLNFNWDTPVALNESLKENIYSCFVCINTRLPLLIIGAPGCSKSLSLRILAKNLKEKVNDDYLSKFKRMRQYPIQGSQNTTTQDIKVVFDKAYNDLLPKNGEVREMRSRQQVKEISVVVFDQIGLAQKSKDNPLKVLHPYLEVSREENLSQRILSFIGISNSELDVSKMSRLLVLRRPPAELNDLVFTAKGIASGYKYGNEEKIKYIIELMTRVYAKFLTEWKKKGTNYPLFYGLRDFYGLIKIFMTKMIEKQVGIQQDEQIIKCAGESILQNFHGWEGTYVKFRQYFNDLVVYSQKVTNPTMHETLELILKTLDKESFRYPLVIVEDHESLCFMKWMIERRYQNKASYMEGSHFVQEKEYSLKLLGQICKNMDHECVLILSNLSEGVKTGLYDFFNKSFTTRASNSNKYLKIRTQQGSLNQIQYLYHEKFNCAYLLLEKDLIDVEPPFLSRFQKYRFSVSKYREQFQGNILNKVERFIGRVQEICRNNQMSHFKASNMFININRPALESMCVSAKEIAGDQGSYREALKRLVMNSGQYFFKVYKHFIEPNGDLPEIRDIMAEAIQSKNNGAGDRNLIIRFTNDKQYTRKFNDKHVASAQFVTFKKQADFDEELSTFFKSSKKTLYITLYVQNESIYLNYVASQIQKARRRALAQNEKVDQKKIRLLYVFEKEKEQSIDKDLAITHFTNYHQQFDDGRLQEVKNISKNQLFNNLITIDSLFAYAHQAFDFKFEGIENAMKAQTTFARLTQALYKKKDGLLCKIAEDLTLFLEPNIEMSEEVIKQMLLDSEVTIRYKDYREALTKYFADRKLLGALAAFMRYLFEKESFMSFSGEQLFQYYRDVEECVFDREIQLMIIEEKSRPNSNYNQLIKEVIESKKQFVKSQYMKMKQTKRLPSVSKKFQVKITKPRLLPFSKAQCETILNYGQKEIAWFVKQIFIYDEKQEKAKFQSAMRTYEDQFKKKTKFNINNQKNLYATHINEDKCLKAMLMLDLLSDFCEEKGLPLKYLGRFYRIIGEFFTGEVKNKKNGSISFSKMVSIMIGYEDIWVQIFKICQALADDGHQLRVQGQVRVATREGIKRYVQKIYSYLQNLLLGANILTNFKNPEKYTSIYINLLFHLQKLEQLTNTSIPNKLKSTRTTLIFIEIFDQNNKAKYIENFMRFSSKIQISSHYHETYNYFQGLKVEASKQQRDKITEFEANQLFYEWFKQQPKSSECLRLFLQNCQNEAFIHNSVATINLFISISTHNNYSNIQETFKRLSEARQQHINALLVALGEKAKSSNFKNNLAIFITNIFIQKLTVLFKNEKIILDNDKKLENILNKVMSSQISGIGALFAYAYFKIYLKEYITRLVNNEKSFGLSRVDELLMKDNPICMNLKFYCLKLLRTFKPIKQIKQQYIKVKKVHWIAALQEMFQEGSSRSISVPNEKNVNIIPTMIANMDIIIASHGGDFNMIDKLVDQANNPYNRYALFNFFMRYYFSMSYNEKQYKNALKDKLLASRAKYTDKLGKVQFQLILRYAQSRFDENIKVENASDFNQDLFAYLNSFNWLLASRSAISPIHSLFFNNGEFHPDFKASFENLFFPCGPENNFIRMAQNIYALTRNNNVGVYICSAQCDYIYSHEDCGWPRDQATCPVCNKPIGCKPGQGHTVNRKQEGARRVQTPVMIDNGGKFYVYNMTALTGYWQMQRNYIQAEINRMKKASVITLGQIKVKLAGYSVQNSERVSTLSYYYFRQNLNSIFYCLLSLGLFSQEQSSALFQGKNVAAAKEFFIKETKSDLNNIKNALNLNNKFYGWLFGMHKNMYRTLIDFQGQFQRYIGNIKESSEELARKLEQQINQKKVASDYGEIYRDMAAALRKGLLTKELDATFDMTAANRFTRDFLQSKVESLIKVYTTMEKFSFAEENASLQGKMQFPRDVYLTEDEIDEAKFSLSRILKIPDKEIKYNEIIINYELNIRENYPFLDYVLKNSDSISSMLDFYNVLSFSNELAKEMEFNYERKDSQKSLSQFVSELWEKKEERVHEILRQPSVVVASWNKLANRMGVLQNDCTVVGRMSNEYSVNTPIQAFLLDNSTKQNVYGLTLSSLFHNFSKMHNELVVLLNARKNQIPQFKCLNLYNQSKKVHPQKLQENDVFMITQKELEENLYKNSISSINYGKNFIFNNFGTYQQYFLMKLLGKCEIITQIKKFKSICYNGEAFAQTSDSSNTLTEVREYFYEELTKQEVTQLQGIVRNRGNRQQTQQYIVKLRGDLERTMVAIRNLNGIIEQKCIEDFIKKLQFDDITYQLRSQTFGRHSIAKIVHIYQLLQFELKPMVIQKLPVRYKEILDEQVEVQLTQLIDELPLQDDYSVTLIEFGYALYRFIARILQGGVQQNDKILMHFLPNREDFWPRGFQEYKLERLLNHQKMSTLPFAYAGHLFEIVERIVRRKVSSSRI